MSVELSANHIYSPEFNGMMLKAETKGEFAAWAFIYAEKCTYFCTKESDNGAQFEYIH